MKTKFKKTRLNATTPQAARPGDAGYDLTACYVEDLGNIVKVYTGIAIEPEEGWYFLLLPRSSCYKQGFIQHNSVGVIDNGYRGEIIGVVHKTTNYIPIAVGSKVFQLVPQKLQAVQFEEAQELSMTARSTGGFGHTGV